MPVGGPRRRGRGFMTLALAGLLWPPGLAAAEGPWWVENQTGRPVCEMRLSAAAAYQWGPDLLAGECLESGLYREMARPAPTGRADVLIGWGEGGYRTYFGLDLADRAYLSLGPEEAELFQRPPLPGRRGRNQL